MRRTTKQLCHYLKGIKFRLIQRLTPLVGEKGSYQMLAGYDTAKAAQATAYFALKSGGVINILKVTKLLYLAEREFMARYDSPMFYDELFSLPEGPVPSSTLDLLKGVAKDEEWDRFMGQKHGYDVRVRKGVDFDDLDSLSKADTSILDYLWKKFGHMSQFRLRDWTHNEKNVPEWRDPKSGRIPITHEDVFRSLRKDESLAEQVEEYRRVAKALTKCA